MALGSRLRILSERMLDDASKLYQLYEVPLHPKWLPVFYMLSETEQSTITDLARAIGHSHPSVSKTVREMAKAQLVEETKDKNDRRRTLVQLSEKGKAIVANAELQYQDVNDAVENALTQTRHDIWKAMDELEFLLQEESLYRRVLKQKRIREAQDLKIVDYQPKYKQAFKNINVEWIAHYFQVEAEDLKYLDHPKQKIINKGGFILFALYQGELVVQLQLERRQLKLYRSQLQ